MLLSIKYSNYKSIKSEHSLSTAYTEGDVGYIAVSVIGNYVLKTNVSSESDIADFNTNIKPTAEYESSVDDAIAYLVSDAASNPPVWIVESQYFTDSNNVVWRVYIDTDGIVTTVQV